MKYTLTLLVLALIALRATAGVSVIAHPDVDAGSVDKITLADIYSLDLLALGDSDLIVFDLSDADPVREGFYAAIGKEHDKMKKLWLRAKLTGSGEPPTAVASLEEMAREVAATPGGIGYVDSASVPKGVKVLATFE